MAAGQVHRSQDKRHAAGELDAAGDYGQTAAQVQEVDRPIFDSQAQVELGIERDAVTEAVVHVTGDRESRQPGGRPRPTAAPA